MIDTVDFLAPCSSLLRKHAGYYRSPKRLWYTKKWKNCAPNKQGAMRTVVWKSIKVKERRQYCFGGRHWPAPRANIVKVILNWYINKLTVEHYLYNRAHSVSAPRWRSPGSAFYIPSRFIFALFGQSLATSQGRRTDIVALGSEACLLRAMQLHSTSERFQIFPVREVKAVVTSHLTGCSFLYSRRTICVIWSKRGPDMNILIGDRSTVKPHLKHTPI